MHIQYAVIIRAHIEIRILNHCFYQLRRILKSHAGSYEKYISDNPRVNRIFAENVIYSVPGFLLTQKTVAWTSLGFALSSPPVTKKTLNLV
jgi:hypothetical protein